MLTERGEAGAGYPWSLHVRVLHSLRRLDMQEVRAGIDQMATALALLPDEMIAPAGYMIRDLICQVRAILDSDQQKTDGEDSRVAWDEARKFCAARNGKSLAAILEDALAPILTPCLQGAVNPLVGRARSFIDDNYARKISLRDVASSLNVSRNYLSSLFRKECGLTITHYIHQRRLEKAMALLLSNGTTVQEVAYKVGYQNYRDFYRNFVRRQRSSPTLFRRTRGRIRPEGDPATATSDLL